LTEYLPDGFVFCASEQTQGKGRRNNSWTSPEGCILASFILRHEMNNLSVIQHVFSIAIVEAILSKQQENKHLLDVKIKWPNDIYIKKSVKIGGILVNANSTPDNFFLLVIGFGLNLNNNDPTECLNNYITNLNKETGSNFSTFGKEELIARIMTRFEELHDILLTEGFNDDLKKRYYENWLHSNQSVNIENGSKVTIKGINENGYLEVVDQNQKIQILDSDGNSFDMMKNLIKQKL
jgi:biotin---protein ligase